MRARTSVEADLTGRLGRRAPRAGTIGGMLETSLDGEAHTARPAAAPARVRVARTPAEAIALRDAWLALGPAHPDADPGVFLAVCELREEVERPHVIALEAEDGAIEALAVARLERTRLLTRVGYRTVMRPQLRSLTAVYGGLIGPPELHERLIAELGAALEHGEADVLRICGQRVDAPLARRLRETIPRWRREPVPAAGPRYALTLRSSMDEYWRSRSRNARGGARRLERRRTEAFGDRLQVVRFGRGADIERLMDDLEAVSAKTYHRGLGVGFERTTLQRRLLELGLANDSYRAWIMYLDGQPIAFADGLRHAGVFHLGHLGFDPDPELRSLGVGAAVILRMIEDLTADPDVAVYDFGFGENEYKRRYGDESFDEADVLVFAPRPRPVAVNLSRGAVLRSVTLAKQHLGDERVAELKRRWRARLSAGAPAGP